MRYYNSDTVVIENGKKHFNLLLLFGAFIGAIIGFILGELLITILGEFLNPIILVGLYFAQLIFFIFLAVLLCEKIDARLNSKVWTNNHWIDQLKRLPLMSLAAFFVLGCLFQFLYGLSVSNPIPQKTDNYIIAIDNSGSMSSNDSKKERFSSVKSFVDELDDGKNVAVILFTHETETLIPLTKVDDAFRNQLSTAFDKLEPNGETDIQAALEVAHKIPVDANSSTMVILMSDGESSVNIRKITTEYNKKNFVLNTVECTTNTFWRNRVLLNLSTSTGGMNYQISEMNQLAGTFSKMLSSPSLTRMLLDYRYGLEYSSSLYSVLRILFISLIGVAMLWALAFMLHNYNVFRKMLAIKIGTGILAGVALEFCLQNFWPAPAARFIMVILLGLLISFYSASISSRSGDIIR